MLIICSPQLGLSPESNSGGEVYDREVIARLCQKGVRVFALLPKHRPFQPHKNLRVSYAPIRSIVPPHLFSALALPYLIKTWRQHRFQLLRIHNPYFLGPAAKVFKSLYPQVPVVGSWLHVEAGINHLIARQTIKAYDRIITISESSKQNIVSDFSYPQEKISVAYPGVDDRFQPGHKNSGKFIIMFIGGLKPRKNPEFLLKVLAKLNRSEVILVFAGTGPLEKQLKQQTKSLQLTQQVGFTGFISEADKLQLYHQASVVVLPSFKEGFGMTLTEAGACGIPVIGNNHSSIKEIIQDGQTGFLARPNDVNDWAKKLLQLIKSKVLRQKMGLVGRQHVRQNFTWEKNIQIHVEIFNQLIQKGLTLRNRKVRP